MKQSAIHIKTLKESPFEGKMESQHLMFRAGMIKKNGTGDYSLMPYGVALFHEVRKTLDRLLEPLTFQRLETLEYSEKELLNQLRSDIVSYKDLPLMVQTDSLLKRRKHSVKHGLIKSRTAPIKGFQLIVPNEEDYKTLDKSLWNQLYKLHESLGLPFQKVHLFSSDIEGAGYGTWLKSPYGDTQFFNCRSCAYCSDELGAKWQKSEALSKGKTPIEEILTPDIKTIMDLEVFLKIKASELMKTLLLQVTLKGKLLTIAVVIRGDRELNISKVAKYLRVQAKDIKMVTDIDCVEAAGTIVGFIGPIGLNDVMLLVDEELTKGQEMVAGANKKDYHLKYVVYGRDFESKHVDDFSTVKEGDNCPVCGQPLYAETGYSIISMVAYKNKLSQRMDIKYRNDQMKDEWPFIITGYVDLYRLLIGYLDNHYDEGGFILNRHVSPFDVHIVIPNTKKETQCLVADQIAFELESKGKRVLLDDRKGSAGAKFKDSDLLGIPVRITSGKRAEEGIVELKYRNEQEKYELTIKEVLEVF